MTDKPHPGSRSGRIVVAARDEVEHELISKFKQILANDCETVIDFFMPIIQKTVHAREPSNPQTLLDPSSPAWHTVSRSQTLGGVTPKFPRMSDQEKLQEKPEEKLPDFGRMGDQELLELYQDPRTDDALRQITRFHMNRRGIEP